MKTIAVSARAKTLNELLKKASRGTLILESADGKRFALTSVDNWEAFDVGSSNDFAQEVERTGKNKKLMKALAQRREKPNGANTRLGEVRKQLGLD